jgi:hypothetical protein
MDATSGLEVFLKAFFFSFKWDFDGSLIMWIQAIVTILAIVFAIKKDHDKAKKFTKLMLIAGFWGTAYGILLCAAACGNPLFPQDKVTLFFFSGLSASLQSTVFAGFGWFLVTLIGIFFVKKGTV